VGFAELDGTAYVAAVEVWLWLAERPYAFVRISYRGAIWAPMETPNLDKQSAQDPLCQ